MNFRETPGEIGRVGMSIMSVKFKCQTSICSNKVILNNIEYNWPLIDHMKSYATIFSHYGLELNWNTTFEESI
jgi:hypothetical protein